MKKLLPLFFAIFASVAFAQSDLPEIGKLSDIDGETKVYLVAEGEARTAMLKTLEKQDGLKISDKPDEAEFFIEYKMVSRGVVPPTGMTIETGEVDVYFYRDKKKVIAWSDSGQGGGFKGGTADRLLKKFLKDFEKPK